jgi:predicted RNA binding protein YcfA (HicA-like mRNA interferase family)
MKITTKKIIRELEKLGYRIEHFDRGEEVLIKDVRNIINEILKQHKNITIK